MGPAVSLFVLPPVPIPYSSLFSTNPLIHPPTSSAPRFDTSLEPHNQLPSQVLQKAQGSQRTALLSRCNSAGIWHCPAPHLTPWALPARISAALPNCQASSQAHFPLTIHPNVRSSLNSQSPRKADLLCPTLFPLGERDMPPTLPTLHSAQIYHGWRIPQISSNPYLSTTQSSPSFILSSVFLNFNVFPLIYHPIKHVQGCPHSKKDIPLVYDLLYAKLYFSLCFLSSLFPWMSCCHILFSFTGPRRSTFFLPQLFVSFIHCKCHDLWFYSS